MSKDKALYINLCASESSVPLFMQPEWMDAVITEGSTWEVALSKDEKGEILAAMVFEKKKKWGLTVLNEPLLTPFCGVWFKSLLHQKQHEQYHFVKSTLDELICQLPPFHYAHFRFSTNLTDWQPFYWADFKQMTRYTYQLNLATDDNLFAQFKYNTQRNIKKGKQHFQVVVSDDLDKWLIINNLTYHRQNIKNPIPNSVWQRVDAFLKNKGQRNIYFSQNTEGVVEAAIYIVFDKKTAYYIAGGTTETGRNLGATHVLLWHAIQEAQKRGFELFDFEGSMLHGVEAFFRGYNGVLTPYYSVWKYRNRLLSFVDTLRK